MFNTIKNLINHSKDVVNNNEWDLDKADKDTPSYELGVQDALNLILEKLNDKTTNTKVFVVKNGELVSLEEVDETDLSEIFSFSEFQKLETAYALSLYLNGDFDSKIVEEVVDLSYELYMKDCNNTSRFTIADAIFEALRNGYDLEELKNDRAKAFDIIYRYI